MVDDGKFYILEDVNEGEAMRVWILEQVANRPYFMRITFIAQISTKMQQGRGVEAGKTLVRSLAAMRNYVHQLDRQAEVPIFLKNEQKNDSNNVSIGFGNMITEGMDLIEEDQNSTIIGGTEANESSDDENSPSRGQAEVPETEYNESYEIQSPIWDIEKIADWGRRISKYSEDQKKFYMQMVPKINEFKGIVNSK